MTNQLPDTIEKLAIRLAAGRVVSSDIRMADIEPKVLRAARGIKFGKPCPGIYRLKLTVIDCVADDESCPQAVRFSGAIIAQKKKMMVLKEGGK